MRGPVLLVACMLALSACGVKSTYKVSRWEPATAPGTGSPPGIVYVLPRGELGIEADVETRSVVAAPYQAYAPTLGFATRDLNPGSSVVAVRGTSLILPDNAQRFVINPEDSGRLVEHGVSFQLTETGGLTGADGTVRDRTTEVVSASVKATASIAGSAFGFSGLGGAAKALDGAKLLQLGAPVDLAEDDLGDKQKGCVKLLIPQTAVGPKPATKAAADAWRKSAEEKATPVCNAAGRLTGLTAKRDLLISEAKQQVAAESYNAVLGAITKEIDELRQLFFPTEKKETRTWRFVLDPNSANKCLPFTAATATFGDWTSCGGAPAGGVTHIRVDLAGSDQPCVYPGYKDGGVVYRVPVSVPFTIAHEGRQFATGRLNIPQFGQCAVAPHVVYGKEAKLTVRLSEGTGMLMGFSSEESKDYSSAIGSVSDAASKVLDEAKSAQERRHALAEATKEEDKTKKDPVAVKKRELELLELQRQIDCYASLGSPCKSNADAK